MSFLKVWSCDKHGQYQGLSCPGCAAEKAARKARTAVHRWIAVIFLVTLVVACIGVLLVAP